MPSQFQILPRRNLVYLRHFGRLTVAGVSESFSTFVAHPDMRPGQNHLVDFSGISWYEPDFIGYMKMQARIASDLTGQADHTFLVVYGPDGPGRDLARIVLNSWDGQPGISVRMALTEEQALDILGERARRFSALFDAEELARSERPLPTES